MGSIYHICTYIYIYISFEQFGKTNKNFVGFSSNEGGNGNVEITNINGGQRDDYTHPESLFIIQEVIGLVPCVSF